MYEDNAVYPAPHELTDSSMISYVANVLSAQAPDAEAEASGDTKDSLQEINKLIDQLSASTAGLEDLKEEAELALQQLLAAQVQLEEQCLALKESKEENGLTLLQLQAAQKQIGEQCLALKESKEENGLTLLQLQAAQKQIGEQCLALKESKEENELILLQLFQVQEELEVTFLDRQEKEAKLKFNRNKCDRLESEIANVRGEADLFQRQLHRVQEELELYFVDNQRKEDKLSWLRGQRELLIRMLRLQSRVQRRFNALDARTALPAMIRQTMPWWKRIQRS